MFVGWGLGLRVVVVVVVHCGRVLKKTVFIGGGKGGDSAIETTNLVEDTGLVVQSLLFFLIRLCFFYFITYMPWVFFVG